MTQLQSVARLFKNGWTGDANTVAKRLRINDRDAREALQRLHRAGVVSHVGYTRTKGRLWAKGPAPMPSDPSKIKPTWRKSDAPKLARPSANLSLVARALEQRGELLDAWWPIKEAA